MGRNRPGKGAGHQDGGALETSDNIVDFTNETVKRLLNELGDFKPGKWTGGKTSDKPMAVLENNARYEGGWNGSVREGYGVQVWSDGSIYQGHWAQDKANG